MLSSVASTLSTYAGSTKTMAPSFVLIPTSYTFLTRLITTLYMRRVQAGRNVTSGNGTPSNLALLELCSPLLAMTSTRLEELP